MPDVPYYLMKCCANDQQFMNYKQHNLRSVEEVNTNEQMSDQKCFYMENYSLVGNATSLILLVITFPFRFLRVM